MYTLKQSLRAMQKYPGTVQQKVSTFLLSYRKAPNSTTSKSPAMLFLKREIRTRIDLVLPNLKENTNHKIRKEVYFQDRMFQVGDKVAIRDYRSSNSKWKIGTILERDGQLHYTVNVHGTLVRRHIDQIRSAGDHLNNEVDDASSWKRWTPTDVCPQSSDPVQPTAETTPPLPSAVRTTPPPMPPPIESGSQNPDPVISNSPGPSPEPRAEPDADRQLPRRSTRVRRPPDRLSYKN